MVSCVDIGMLGGYNGPMLKSFAGLVLLFSALAPASLAAPQTPAQPPRVSTLYTAWDNYYFYAGFVVNDTDVIGTNTSPISQPQQDDDVEVFFETDNAHAPVRTTKTFQMAVSAAGGAYFSQGNGTRIPGGKTVWTYKFAANTDGTLNKSDDKDSGYTVELAIPWKVLGQDAPPAPGTVWGFNAISRDRTSLESPANSFYSLSPYVKSGADVQNPARWVPIVFDSNGMHQPLDLSKGVVCPFLEARVPRIDGDITSGEWPERGGVSFGTSRIMAEAPSREDEPNTAVNPLDTPPPADELQPNLTTSQSINPETNSPTGFIRLPGGAVIKVVPGGITNPEGMAPPTIKQLAPTGPFVNPLNPKYNPKKFNPEQDSDSLTGSLTLTPYSTPRLIMAIYRTDYGLEMGDPNSKMIDTPVDGAGYWFSALRPEWHRQQLEEMRFAGIDVAVLHIDPDKPEQGYALNALTEALKELKAAKADYPLIAVDGTNLTSAQLKEAFDHIPREFRAMLAPSLADLPGVIVYGKDDGAVTLSDGSPITLLTTDDGVATVSPGGLSGGTETSRDGGKYFVTAWTNAIQAAAPYVLVDSWNDYVNGTEVEPSLQNGEAAADAALEQIAIYSGKKQWHAKYLGETVPRNLYPRVLYQVPLQVENAGTLPWSAGAGYSLSVRWYRDGRLFEDSSDRIPIGTDVQPGQSATLTVGLVAMNSFGDDLEPGNYTVVFDMVKGENSWFSYAGDSPLQVNVTVHSGDEDAPNPLVATFLSAATPGLVGTGGDYSTTLVVRNDGPNTLASKDYDLVYKILRSDPQSGARTELRESDTGPLTSIGLDPGLTSSSDAIVTFKDSTGNNLAPGSYIVHWFLKPVGTATSIDATYDEPVQVLPLDHAASFLIADFPHEMTARKSYPTHIALQNLGCLPIGAKSITVRAHWFNQDGTPAETGIQEIVNPRTVAVGASDGGITLMLHAPTTNGKYLLGFDLLPDFDPNGSTIGNSRGNDFEIGPVTVTGQ